MNYMNLAFKQAAKCEMTSIYTMTILQSLQWNDTIIDYTICDDRKVTIAERSAKTMNCDVKDILYDLRRSYTVQRH